jgi:hypothetical protein
MAFELVQPAGPEPPVRLQPRVDLGKGRGLQLIPSPLRIAADPDKPGLAQHPQVPGGAGLGQPEQAG